MIEKGTKEYLSALNAILQVALEHPNLLQQEAFEMLSEAMERFVPFRMMVLIAPDSPEYVRVYAISRGGLPPLVVYGGRVPLDPVFDQTVFVQGGIIHREDTRVGTEFEQMIAAAGYLSYLAVPVRTWGHDAEGGRSQGKVVASLVFGYAETGGGSTAPMDLLDDIGAIIGRCFERAVVHARQVRFAMILDTSGDAMLAWDHAGLITDLNGAAIRLTGRGRDELIGMPIRTLLGPLPDLEGQATGVSDSSELKARSGASSQPQGTRMELVTRGADGAEARRTVSATITTVEDDPSVAVHALLRDLSNVVLAEQEAAERLARIRELEEQHRAMLDNAPLIIFRLDPKTTELTYLNRYAERILGRSVAEALQTAQFLRNVHADVDGAAAFETAVAHAKRGAKSIPYEARLSRPEGEPITAQGTVYPLLSDRGEVVAIEGVLADVTGEHAARARLVQIDRLSTIGTLAAGVAHEINNPAAFILLGLDMLDRLLRGRDVQMGGSVASNVTELSFELRDSIKRIVDIARDLRLFASHPTSDAPRRILTDVNRTVESALSLTRGQIIERAQIVRHLADVSPVLMDDGRLGQVLVNLLVNAAQAIPKSGGHAKQGALEHAVTVETRNKGSKVEIEVRDTGVGISQDVVDRIWAPFFTTKSPEVGTGLGLAISREIVERSGGRIWVESPVAGQEPPGGSRFVVSLPAAVRTEEMTPVASPLPRLVSRAVRVLIIEDEQALARALAEQLGRVHKTTIASCAEEALLMIEEGQEFDVFLCDLRMPGISGEVFYTKMKENHPDLAMRFIFMTGVGFGADMERFVASAAQPLLEKPFTTEDALEAIAGVVSVVQAKRP